jgi:hypothetical protein
MDKFGSHLKAIAQPYNARDFQEIAVLRMEKIMGQ